jgi:hypothetical protein
MLRAEDSEAHFLAVAAPPPQSAMRIACAVFLVIVDWVAWVGLAEDSGERLRDTWRCAVLGDI